MPPVTLPPSLSLRNVYRSVFYYLWHNFDRTKFSAEEVIITDSSPSTDEFAKNKKAKAIIRVRPVLLAGRRGDSPSKIVVEVRVKTDEEIYLEPSLRIFDEIVRVFENDESEPKGVPFLDFSAEATEPSPIPYPSDPANSYHIHVVFQETVETGTPDDMKEPERMYEARFDVFAPRCNSTY